MIRKGKGQIVSLPNQLLFVMKWLVLWMWGQQWLLITFKALSLLQYPCRQTEETWLLYRWTTKRVKCWLACWSQKC